MSKTLTTEIQQYNKEATELENNACENIFSAYKELAQALLIDQSFLSHQHDVQKKDWLEILNEWLLAALKGMLLAKTAEELAGYKEQFAAALNRLKTTIPHPETSEIYKLINLCEKNANILADVRSNYLEKISGHASIAKNAGWMVLGAALIVVGIVIPPIEIVAISIGMIGLGYGVIDYAKEAATSYMENRFPKLGKRQSSTVTEPIRKLTTPTPNTETPKNSYKKTFKVAGLITSSIGLISGFAGLLVVLPGLAALFPPALPFVLAGIGLAAAIGAGAIYAHKLYSERKALKVAQAQQQQIEQTAQTQLEQIENQKLDSTALMEKELSGAKEHEQLSHQQEEILEDKLKHMDETFSESEDTSTASVSDEEEDTEGGSGDSDKDSEKIVEELEPPEEDFQPK